VIDPLKVSWDDLRCLLTLAEQETMAATAAALRVHPTTVARHLSSLENLLQARLFDRRGNRYVLTGSGRFVFGRAKKMEAAALTIAAADGRESEAGRPAVRISAVETLAAGYLAAQLPAFIRANPGIRIELAAQNEAIDLERREADIALRYRRPAGGIAVSRRLADLNSFAYAARSLQENTASFREMDWLSFARPMEYLPEQQWLEANIAPDRIVASANGGVTYQRLMACGLGAGLLPSIDAAAGTGLLRLPLEGPIVSRTIWLLVLDDVRRKAHVRAAIDWLVHIFERDAALLAG